ncbi:MAG TPA: hypothetical protein VE077_08155 [Candidatus Methylomirabilis sp.]|nr:hypothetical protein [Candidatus Methylomirabilis sp.]
MRLRTKWLLVSIVGGVLITVVLFVFADTFLGVVRDMPGPVGAVAKVVLWPVAVCVYLSGPGPSIGPPDKHLHERTPVQDFAVMAGLGLSWVLYSSLVFFIVWLRRRGRTSSKTSGASE